MRIGIEAQRILRKKKHGMDVVAVELIKALQTIDKKNEYVIFCRNGEDAGTITETDNFTVKKFPSFSYGDWEQIKLPSIAKKMDLDVLHCTANTAPITPPCPLVLTLHDIIYLENVNFKGTAYQNLGNLYRRVLVPKLVNKSNLIITVSEFERQNIINKLKVPEEKVVVVYNAVSERFNNNYASEQLIAFKKQYGLPDKYILFLGNTAPKKNTKNVIKAYIEYCNSEKAPIPLVLLDYSKELVLMQLEELQAKQLIDQFVFPGYVPHNQMPLMYNAATLFLYPSLRESFGLPILEAMACGVPVITSATSSMPEVAQDAAVLINPFSYKEISEAISVTLTSPDKLSTYKSKGLERSKDFTWENAATQVLNIYEKIEKKAYIN
jgi:glycosyltransferase involved in cell wall biosynthesis